MFHAIELSLAIVAGCNFLALAWYMNRAVRVTK